MSPTSPPAPSTLTHQALYRRWRAQTFAQIVGQEAVVETLRNAVRLNRVAHAILFVGPRGTGKTSLARILAKALNCEDLRDGDPCDACPPCVAIREGRALDLVEIDAASNRGIDAIRELRERIHYAPTDLRRKVYILDEAHQITKDAWNALLKSLEEPPDFVVFMFASTHPQEFPPAILSRLQRYDVRRLTVAEIEGKLHRILEADGRSAEPEAVSLIARLAAGGMRDAESMLDQLLASAGDRLDQARVRDLLGLADAEAVEAFLAALVDGEPAAGIATLDRLEERGRDVRVFLDQVVEALRASLTAALSGKDPRPPDRLAAVARRLAAIDPNRSGVGGLRLQLELALFAEGERPAAATAVADRAGTILAAAVDASPGSAPAPAPVVPSPAAVVVPAATVPNPEAARGRSGAAAAAAPSTGHTPPPPARPGERQARPASTSDRSRARREAASATQADPGVAIAPSAGSSGPAPARARAAEPAPAAASPRGGPGQGGSAASSEAVRPPGTPDLDRLVAGWAGIVASVGPATRAVISECRPLSIDEGGVTLGFPETKGFLKDVAERKRRDIEEAVGGFLGRPVGVRCVATNLDLAPLPADPDGAFILAEARRIFADDLADVGEVS